MKKWPWIILCLLIILADQLTKLWALAYLSPYDPVHIMPMVNLTLAFNTGAAFSFLSGAGAWHHWFFIAFSGLMSLAILYWFINTNQTSRFLLLGLSLILAGAIGNLLDRLIHGHVIDFIDIYYNQYHWPVFNLADTAICIGAIMLLIDLIKHPE